MRGDYGEIWFHYHRSRYKEGLRAAEKALAEEPDSVELHFLRTALLTGMERGSEAVKAAKTALRIAPDHPYSHHAMAMANLELGDLEQAMSSARELLRIDPDYSPGHLMAASIFARKAKWEEALRAVDDSLELDPEGVAALNLKSTILTQMGRLEEAEAVSSMAAKQNPENPGALCAMGWRYLSMGDYKSARSMYAQALRMDPMDETAKAGLLQALQGDSLFFRPLFRLQMWMSTLGQNGAWAFIIVAYFVGRGIYRLGKTYPEYGWALDPIYYIYIFLVLMTWIGNPAFYTLMRLAPEGRLLLTERQAQASNWLIAPLISAGLFLAAYYISGDGRFGWWTAVCAIMAVPLSKSISVSEETVRRPLMIFSGILGALGMAAPLALTSKEPGVYDSGFGLLMLFFVGLILYSWAANWLILRARA